MTEFIHHLLVLDSFYSHRMEDYSLYCIRISIVKIRSARIESAKYIRYRLTKNSLLVFLVGTSACTRWTTKQYRCRLVVLYRVFIRVNEFCNNWWNSSFSPEVKAQTSEWMLSQTFDSRSCCYSSSCTRGAAKPSSHISINWPYSKVRRKL
jgi:hypothetical protein